MIPIPPQFAEISDIFEKLREQRANVVSIVSAEQGEGRTSLAYALARRAAYSGQKTLLVDLNTANPAMALELCLEERMWSFEEENSESAIQTLGKTGLHVLIVPKQDIMNTRTLPTEKVDASMAIWRSTFDMVIIDTSPLNRKNASNIAPHMVAALSDGAIFLVQANDTVESQVLDARARLDSVQARLLACVINDAKNPSLPNELVRESHRLDKYMPRLMERIRKRVRKSPFLNQDI